MYEFRLTVMSLAMMVNSMQARNLQIKNGQVNYLEAYVHATPR